MKRKDNDGAGRALPHAPGPKISQRDVDGQYFLWRVALPGSDSREVAITRAQAERTLTRLNLRSPERGDVTK